MHKFRHYISLLGNRQFFALWMSQIASEIAYHLVTFSLVILIFELTEETIYVTVLVVATACAPILFSTVAGIFADSYDRRRVMLVGHAIRVILGIVMLFIFPFPILLLPIAFLLASVAQFFEPAQVSSIPALVKDEQLFAANSYFSFTRYTMFLAGYMLAGPLLARTSPITVFIIILSLYCIAWLSVWTIGPLRQHLGLIKQAIGIKIHLHMKQLPERLKEGFRFMVQDKVVGFLAFQVSFIFAVEKGFITLLPAFALDWLGVTLDDISLYLILPTGIGTLVGVLAANALKTRMARNRMVTSGTLLDGFALLALSAFGFAKSFAASQGLDPFTFSLWYIAVLAFFSGFADPFIIVPAQTVLQERTPKEKRGRVFGNLVLLMNLLGLIPVVAIGLITKFVSIVAVIAGLGTIVVIVGIFGIVYWRKFRLESELQPGS